MRRTRRQTKRTSPEAESNATEPKKKKTIATSDVKLSDGSSSDSDIETYLKSAKEIDLNSSFFNTHISEKPSFEKIEKDIFSGINRLSDSESEEEPTEKPSAINEKSVSLNTESIVKASVSNFEHIQEFNRKLDEAKKHIEIYNSKKDAKESNVDIFNMLQVNESQKPIDSTLPNSSEYESFSDEEGDWNEVKSGQENVLIPKKGIEITLELPTARKKKGVDLMDVVKRRLNRIKKENQVYIHKVHLLCWIAHGNYLNRIIGSENLMGLVLSLLPSQQCYPPARLNLSYLGEIVEWYGKHIRIRKSTIHDEIVSESLLEEQITKREAHNYKMFIYIFVCLMRSLGIRCRLMLSLQVEPLRPSSQELCSLKKESRKSDQPSTTKADTKIHKAANTPGTQSSKKKNVTKVISSKKVNHFKKDNLSILKKKISFEDSCFLESNKTSQNPNKKKTNENKSSQKSEKETRKREKSAKEILGKDEKVEAAGGTSRKQTNPKIKETKKERDKEDGQSSNKTRVSKTKSKCLDEELTVLQRDENKMSKSSPKQTSMHSQNGDKEHDKEVAQSRNNARASKTKSKGVEEELTVFQRNENKMSKSSTKQTSIQSENADKQENKEVAQSRNKPKASKTKSKGVKEELTVLQRNENKMSKSSPIQTSIQSANDNKEDVKVKDELGTIRRSHRLHKGSDASETLAKVAEVLKPSTDLKHEDNTNAAGEAGNNDTKKDLSSFKKGLPFKLKRSYKKTEEITMEKETKDSSDLSPAAEKILILQVDGGNDDEDSDTPVEKNNRKVNFAKLKSGTGHQCAVKTHPTRLRKVTTQYKEIDSDEDFRTANSSPVKKSSIKTSNGESASTSKSGYRQNRQLDVRNDIIDLVKQSIPKGTLRSKLARNRPKPLIDSDGDYVPEGIKKNGSKEKPVKVKRRIPMKKDLIEMEKRKLLEKEEEKRKRGVNVWVEVFVEAEEKWISVDVMKGQVHCIKEIFTRATHPITYILSWDNENHIKDLTKRYCVNWNTVTRKLRVDSKWWDATLSPYKSPANFRDREEDEDLARQQLEQPLPTTISEYKNHPIYVLKRHLLKFEAIYPPDAVTLGFVRSEPVYSRDCVYTLHSREIWLKHAKVVKSGEKPYKIVKARPKYDKLSNSVITDKPLEIFGEWQVEDYVPPTAENGVVPRNAYGNVELFKPTMLPKGTVHLQLPGLNKTARKMNIDCAPAVVGFDFHGGWSHPTFDGFVVCEEYSEQLIAGWYQEQEESEKRAVEKMEKRVYDNWRRLIKGLLIRERLKARYDFGETSNKPISTKKKSLTLKKRKILSDNESD